MSTRFAAGAAFHDAQRVAAIDLENGGVRVRFPGGDSAEAAALIGADGANGVVRTALGLPRLRNAVALEAKVGGVPALWEKSLGLDLGSVAGGYGWVFPKGDHCNLGVGGWPVAGPTLRRDLDVYAASEGFDPAGLHGVRGHHLPLRDPHERARRRPRGAGGRRRRAHRFRSPARALATPSALGRSLRRRIGRFLDGAVDNLNGYAQTVQREIEPELAASRQVQALFHQRPWPYVQLLHRYSRFWQALCRTVRGEQTYVGIKADLGLAARLFDAAAAYATRGLMRRSGWA